MRPNIIPGLTLDPTSSSLMYRAQVRDSLTACIAGRCSSAGFLPPRVIQGSFRRGALSVPIARRTRGVNAEGASIEEGCSSANSAGGIGYRSKESKRVREKRAPGVRSDCGSSRRDLKATGRPAAERRYTSRHPGDRTQSSRTRLQLLTTGFTAERQGSPEKLASRRSIETRAHLARRRTGEAGSRFGLAPIHGPASSATGAAGAACSHAGTVNKSAPRGARKAPRLNLAADLNGRGSDLWCLAAEAGRYCGALAQQHCSSAGRSVRIDFRFRRKRPPSYAPQSETWWDDSGPPVAFSGRVSCFSSARESAQAATSVKNS
ncbi:hypothetical protein MTO96_006635 [Rhipicephalus appendiculatus]